MSINTENSAMDDEIRDDIKYLNKVQEIEEQYKNVSEETKINKIMNIFCWIDENKKQFTREEF